MTNSFRPNTTIADRENYKFPTQRLEEEQLREQQEQQKQQAAAAAQKAEATRQKQQQREAQTNSINIPESINQLGQPVTDVFNEASARLGEFLGIRSAEETRSMQQQAPQRMREVQENFER